MLMLCKLQGGSLCDLEAGADTDREADPAARYCRLSLLDLQYKSTNNDTAVGAVGVPVTVIEGSTCRVGVGGGRGKCRGGARH